MSAEFELPGVYIDDVVFSDLGDGAANPFLVLANRNPEPDEFNVRGDVSFAFDLLAESGASISLDEITVSVDGGPFVLVHDGVSFQAGWNDPESAVTTPDAQTVRVVVDPVSDFDSLQNVTVRVKASTASLALDESYTFQIEDLTSPIVEAAAAPEKQVVRVTFNEPVLMTTGLTGALNPSNWAFTRYPTVELPSVQIEPEFVAMVDNSTVDITLDIEMTPGAPYTVTATGIADAFGNIVAAPTNAVDFTGYVPPAPEGRNFNLWMMVISQTNRERDTSRELRAFVECLQEVTNLHLCMIDRWTDILDPDIAPEPFIDAMLCDLGNPFTKFSLTLTEKRKLIRILVDAYKQKGTAVGIINLVRFFVGIEVTVEIFNGFEDAWILGESELGVDSFLSASDSFNRYSFQITSPEALTDEERERIECIADYMKPAHTHLIQILEPTIPVLPDHLELGLSELGVNWLLH